MRTFSRRTVALLVETSNTYSRELLHGIRAHLREHGPWSIHLSEQARGSHPPAWLENWNGDGIIARIETDQIADAVRQVGVPVVNVSASGVTDEFPCVINDSEGVTRLAFEHLRERAFHHVAYFGDPRFRWSQSHERFFQAMAGRNGMDCHCYPAHLRDVSNWNREQVRIRRWLERLPKPVGIMACYDVRARLLLEVCRLANWKVPDEIAVVGVHNDDLLCDLCDPPLSSVIPNARRAGSEAASLLERMMNGEQIETRRVKVPPLGVATRQSTDVVAVADPRIAGVLRFIRDHATEGITVTDLLRQAGISRSLLEKRFNKLLGRTPHAQILSVRLQSVKELLTQTDLPVARIAERTGFENAEYLSVAFKRETGETPRQFRNRAGDGQRRKD